MASSKSWGFRFRAADGFPEAVLNRNTPAAYLVPGHAGSRIAEPLV